MREAANLGHAEACGVSDCKLTLAAQSYRTLREVLDVLVEREHFATDVGAGGRGARLDKLKSIKFQIDKFGGKS